MIETPPNTDIEITETFEGTTITIPQQIQGRLQRSLAVLFSAVTLFALGYFGYLITTSAGPSGRIDNYFAAGVVAVLFILATLLILWQAYRMIRPASPAVFTLTTTQLHYDSGFIPYIPPSRTQRHKFEAWRKLFEPRTIAIFDHRAIQTLHLREHPTSNRLTIDHNNKRLELAVGVSEIEREWLYSALRNHYRF